MTREMLKHRADEECHRMVTKVARHEGYVQFPCRNARIGVGRWDLLDRCRCAPAKGQVFIEQDTRRSACKVGHAEQQVAVCPCEVRLDLRRATVAGLGFDQATQILAGVTQVMRFGLLREGR